MSSFFTLPELAGAEIVPPSTTAHTSNFLPSLPSLPELGGSVGSVVSGAVKGAATAEGVGGLFGGLSVTDLITVVVGIVFILGAVFTFDKSREVIVSTAKKGAAAAAAAA